MCMCLAATYTTASSQGIVLELSQYLSKGKIIHSGYLSFCSCWKIILYPTPNALPGIKESNVLLWLSLCVNLIGPQGTRILGEALFWIWKLRVFLDESSISIGRLSYMFCSVWMGPIHITEGNKNNKNRPALNSWFFCLSFPSSRIANLLSKNSSFLPALSSSWALLLAYSQIQVWLHTIG